MYIAIDAVGIRGHGGAAVLCELLHWLPAVRPDWKWLVFLFDRHLREFDDPTVIDRVTIEHTHGGDGGWARLHWIRSGLQKRVRAIGADVIFSFANIGSDHPCRPQVVFVQQPNAFFDEGISAWDILRRARMRFMRQQILRGARSSRAVIVQIEAMQRRIEELAPYLHGKICVIPSGYRTPSANPVVRPEIKALIDSASRPRLIYVSHPTLHKNHPVLFSALPLIAEKFNSVSLLLTLDIDIERGSTLTERTYYQYVQPIRYLYNRSISRKNLIFLGRLNSDEVRYALSNSDLLVFPSLSESFGLGLVESMEAGCPMLAADMPYAHDVAGDAALYFDPRNPTTLANVAITVLRDPAALKRMKAIGLMTKKKYSYENIAQKITKIIENATNEE